MYYSSSTRPFKNIFIDWSQWGGGEERAWKVVGNKWTVSMGRHAHADRFIYFPICILQLLTTKTCDKGGGSEPHEFHRSHHSSRSQYQDPGPRENLQWDAILPSGTPRLVRQTHKEAESNTRMGHGPLRYPSVQVHYWWTAQQCWGRAPRTAGMRRGHPEGPGQRPKPFRNSLHPQPNDFVRYKPTRGRCFPVSWDIVLFLLFLVQPKQAGMPTHWLWHTSVSGAQPFLFLIEMVTQDIPTPTRLPDNYPHGCWLPRNNHHSNSHHHGSGLPILELHINRITQNFLFCVWPFLGSGVIFMSVRLPYVCTYNNSLFSSLWWIPLCAHTTTFLSILLVTAIWVVFSRRDHAWRQFQLLCLSQIHSFLLGIYLRVELSIKGYECIVWVGPSISFTSRCTSH